MFPVQIIPVVLWIVFLVKQTVLRGLDPTTMIIKVNDVIVLFINIS